MNKETKSKNKKYIYITAAAKFGVLANFLSGFPIAASFSFTITSCKRQRKSDCHCFIFHTRMDLLLNNQKILKCYHSNESYWAVLSCGTVYCAVQDGSTFWVCGWNPKVWPFKWKLLSSTFLWYCLLCCTKWFYLLRYVDETGAPKVNFRKISVRKTIWNREFSEHLL